MSRRPGSHLLYEDKIEPCLLCGGSGRTAIIVERDDNGKIIKCYYSIYCTKCGTGFERLVAVGDPPYEVIRDDIIDYWNDDSNWKS